ncbi:MULTISPECIES: hypothetical protein [Sphingobacterium]|uniref:hypothetical protein n=1 Tax=Sphingobacterium TaxID=28453 RepID=UPI00257DD48C|nr:MULTISPECIES: hypothetical protein [Sphingobacterium]
MNSFEFKQPEFLLCEIGIKDSTLLGDHILNDERIWVYHLKSQSLVEFVFMNELGTYNFNEKHKEFTYFQYRYIVFFVKNNCNITKQSEDVVLDLAWDYLESFFIWEDKTINIRDHLKSIRSGNDFNIN